MTRTAVVSVLVSLTALAHIAFAQPVILTVLNGASFSAAISPGSVISILGANFASAPATAPAGSPPDTLGGVSVKIGGLTAPLLFVSPRQINAVIPFQAADSKLSLTTPAGTTAYNARLTRNAPAIFTEGGAALIFDRNFNQIDTVHPQDAVIFYATGLGPVDASGRVVDNLDVYLGERKAQLLYAGLAPGMPGVYQVNVVAPRLATDRLYLRAGGWQSNIVYISSANFMNQFALKRPARHGSSIGIPAGNNTANARGTIDGLYPSADPGFPQVGCVGDPPVVSPCGSETFSVTLYAGTFTVSFDINPTAVPFDIAAVGDAGGAVISFDPAARTYTATVTTPDQPSRTGDFSATVVPLWDYTDCDADGVCRPFNGPSVIPVSRIPPFWIRATRQLPPATTTDPASPNGVFQSSGTISGSHFTIDGQSNSALANFGGFLQTALGPFGSATATFSLYVDGRVIATKNIRYVPAERCFLTGPLCWGLPQ